MHPRGVQPFIIEPPLNVSRISIHAPTRGATFVDNEGDEYHIISIHAPTRGATIFLLLSAFMLLISIHAPTRGAT